MTAREDLVLDLCHEVGNLVGAIRLNADRIEPEASARELASVAVEIDDVAARIRSWLALVRPLLDREHGDETGVDASTLVQGVAETLDESGTRGVRVEVERAVDLSRARGRLETLHHVVALLAFHAVDEASAEGCVRLVAERGADGEIAIAVEDDGAGPPPDANAGARTGRSLALAAAEAIAERLGGRAAALREAERTVVRLALPRLDGLRAE